MKGKCSKLTLISMILSQDENVVIIGLLQILETLTRNKRFC